MAQSTDDGNLETNLFQAIQKNKIIQGQLNDRQHSYYLQMVKYMKSYNTEKNYNQELLYTWKKELYLRQLKKNLHECERNKANVNNAYYEYQLRNLHHLIAGRPGLIIPPGEEERRLSVKAKYQEFLKHNPLHTSTSTDEDKLAGASVDQSSNDQTDDEIRRGLEETWKNIHAQSAVWSRRKQSIGLPTLRRSSTMHDIRRKSTITRNYSRPTLSSKTLTRTTSDIINSSSEENVQRPSNKLRSNHFELCDHIEPPPTTSEVLDKQTRTDLLTIRSIRRPRRSPTDLNYIYEARQRIYQMTRRVLDYQICRRRY